MADMRFEEKILYKCRQHWIIPATQSIKLLFIFIIPITILLWFITNYSLWMTLVGFIILCILILGYRYYLWYHSWLFIWNQKVTLSVRNGMFSQYAMNIRYRNIRDSAVSKNSMIGFLLKYGTLFIRSTNSEGDFIAKYVSKVGKIYALINALSRYSDNERAHIDSIEKLHAYHTKQEFTPATKNPSMSVEIALENLKNTPWVGDAIELSLDSCEYIRLHEEQRNHGVLQAISRKNIICLIHNSDWRNAPSWLVSKDLAGNIVFPGLPFPEIIGKWVISGSPSKQIHEYLLQFFPYASHGDATIIVGWDI